MTTLFTRRQLLLATAALAGLPGSARAQPAWPARPVNLVVPFPAGGGTDAFARPLGAQFTRLTGQNLLIDNKGGGGGTVGAAVAAKAPADGYNYFMGGVHHAIAPSVYPKLQYDLQQDFVPLILVARVPQVVVVNPKRVQARTVKELIDLAKKNPGKLNYASAGSGTSHHLAGELFKQQTGTFITHIPYRGAGPALQALIAGEVDLMFDGLGSSAGHIKGGRIVPLMMAGRSRNPAFPDVPSARESGLPDYDVSTWYGIWAPKGTPAEAQAAMIEAVRKSAQTPENKQVWAGQGAEFANLEAATFGGFIQLEMAKWARVVKATGGVRID
ncbi:MAG TPA: tripartite tricarboxylate transporter substrate-binding protein [Ottowia sp.]|nr:tripartite tricarboxylate transporter substrate-binding protein [Ottowia sp.]